MKTRSQGIPDHEAPEPGVVRLRTSCSCAGPANVARSASSQGYVRNDNPECDAQNPQRMQQDIDEAFAEEDAECCEENRLIMTLKNSFKQSVLFAFTLSFIYGIFLLCYHISLVQRRNANTEKQLKELCERVVNLTDQVTSSAEDTKAEIARNMRADFALESAGGRIVTTRDTRTFSLAEPTYLLGILPMCREYNPPTTIINPSVHPGECWAFEGSQGSAVIKLMGRIRVTGVSIEHIPPVLAPTGDITTAPKHFSLHGLIEPDEVNGHNFGAFLYEKNGTALQYFSTIHQTTRAFDYVELKIHSNHGHQHYTCLYRVRIHGEIENPAP